MLMYIKTERDKAGENTQTNKQDNKIMGKKTK